MLKVSVANPDNSLLVQVVLYWLGDARQQALTKANVDLDLRW